MENKTLKVTDLIGLEEADYKNTLTTINNLKKLSRDYHTMTDLYDPFELERIKRAFDSYMQTFVPQYAKVKKYKGSQHVYLDEVRKKIKAEALDILLEEGMKITAADTIVYKSDYYVQRVNLMEDIKEFMIKVELYYERFNSTFDSIVSSLYTAKKEFENSSK